MTIHTDALIVGAGPAGLFQVFELGLLDIKAHVVETLPQVGGQCSALYPDKPIYDIPALPVCGAQELVDRLMQQIEPFEPQFHLSQEVTHVIPDIEGGFHVQTSAGRQFKTRTIVIAGGVGSFQPRRLRVNGAEQYVGSQLHYNVASPSDFADRDIVIAGGGDSALDWALELQGRARSVILIHRRDEFRAAPASVARMRGLCNTLKMQFLQGTVKELIGESGQLVKIRVAGSDAVTRTVELDHLLVFFGLSPKLGPIADWGLELTRNQIPVDTHQFQTSVSGIFAVGDINTYPGKKKLILSGFHEAALASFAVQKHLNPETKSYLQYTTTSPKMHERLGIKKVV